MEQIEAVNGGVSMDVTKLVVEKQREVGLVMEPPDLQIEVKAAQVEGSGKRRRRSKMEGRRSILGI
ncbi:hypothetical protein E2562_032274 [Oryza meyeriana var. granulata]|uniref:Uncharacterized protein n=1 Tax=Oryza meyeriana var. granulata TaxID=110450 RepID=A0A6G1F0H4_9ORYZ|nr:hypothetical protein E2562_032274 [Oryza meyeriana var. granulata]